MDKFKICSAWVDLVAKNTETALATAQGCIFTYTLDKYYPMKVIILSTICALVSSVANADNSKYYVELYGYRYDEPSVMTKNSETLFLSLGFQDYGKDGVVSVIGNGRYFYGTTKYDSTSSGTTNGDLTFGYLLEAAFKWTINDINVFTGLGYRTLYDDWGGKRSSTGHYSYDRASKYVYLPIGYIDYLENNGYFKIQYNYLLEGKQTSYAGYLGGSHRDTINTQNSGYGFDVEYSPDLNYSVFLRYWDIEDSNVVNNVYEPNNTTFELGYKYLF